VPARDDGRNRPQNLYPAAMLRPQAEPPTLPCGQNAEPAFAGAVREPIANAARGRRAGTSPAAKKRIGPVVGAPPKCCAGTPLLAAWPCARALSVGAFARKVCIPLQHCVRTPRNSGMNGVSNL
jgi:hypothetical protein